MKQLFKENGLLKEKPFSVLHIDGDMLMRTIFKKAFSSEMFQLDSAADGREAFVLLESKQYAYDIVITEMYMNYANGYEIVSQIIKNAPKSKIIITSNMSFFHICEGLNLEKENYFRKPLVIGKLTEHVKNLMRQEGAKISSPCPEDSLLTSIDEPLLSHPDALIFQIDTIGHSLAGRSAESEDVIVQEDISLNLESLQLSAEDIEFSTEDLAIEHKAEEATLPIRRQEVTASVNTSGRWW